MPNRKAATPITLAVVKTACSNCNLHELCLPLGLSHAEIEKLDEVVSARHRIKRGEHLYRAGETFNAIYAVRSGFFKTDVLLEDGREQVTGFQMTGELLGLDASAQKPTPAMPSPSRTARSAPSPSRTWKGSRARSRRCSTISTRS